MRQIYLDNSLSIAEHRTVLEKIRAILEKSEPNKVVTIGVDSLNLSACGVRLHLALGPARMHLASAWISSRVQDGLAPLDRTFAGVLKGDHLVSLDQFSIRSNREILVAWGPFSAEAAGLLASAIESFDDSMFDEDGYVQTSPSQVGSHRN